MTHENDPMKPLLGNTPFVRWAVIAVGAALTALTTFIVSSILNIESNGRLIVSELEDIQAWQTELESDLTNLRRDMEAQALAQAERVDSLYELVLRELIASRRYDDRNGPSSQRPQ